MKSILAPIGASFPLVVADMKFTPTPNEVSRTYTFPNGKVTIDGAIEMHVSPSNGHRILDSNGAAHYVPTGWLHITWTVREGFPAFVA